MAQAEITVEVKTTIKRMWQVRLGALLILAGFRQLGERVAMAAIKIEVVA